MTTVRRSWVGDMEWWCSRCDGTFLSVSGTCPICAEAEVGSRDPKPDPVPKGYKPGDVYEANPKDAVGSRKPPTRYIPPTFLYPVARVMELGAKKYGEFNWRRAQVRLSIYLEAINRHKDEALEGRTADPESGQHPVAHIAACCAIILDALAHGNLINDLPQNGNEKVLQWVIDNASLKAEKGDRGD